MVRLYALLFVIQIVLAVVALISCLSAEPDEIRALPRVAWVMIILFFPLVGSIGWFLAGRPVPSGGAARPGPGAVFRPRERPRQVAPDDDPDFLKSISAEQAKRDREMFDRWEADLRRREDDLRRGEDDLRRGEEDDSDQPKKPGREEKSDRERKSGREEKRPEA